MLNFILLYSSSERLLLVIDFNKISLNMKMSEIEVSNVNITGRTPT
jgi:hypothetical protein